MKFRELEKKIIEGKILTPEEEVFLGKTADEYWTEHPDVLRRFPRWKKYMAWVAGYQNYDFNTVLQRLVQVPKRKKSRLIFNRLRSFVRTMLAKLCADKPNPGVIPKTSDGEDVEAARAGDKLIEHLKEKWNLEEELKKLKLWIILCNRGYIRVYWDEDGYGVTDYTKESEYDDKTGKEIGKKYVIQKDEGEIGLETVSPFNCRQDPLHFEENRWRWFMYGEEVDAEAIEEEYDLKSGSLTEPSNVMKDAYELTSHDENAFTGTSGADSETIVGRTVVLKEFWTPKIFVLIAGDKVLKYRKNPYGEIPYYQVEDRIVPIDNYEKGFSYNEPPIKDAIAIQREYNQRVSLISDAIRIASKLKVMTPLASLLSKKQFTNDYGTFIDYNPKQGKPEQLKLDPLPGYVQTSKDDLEREFEGCLNIHEASFGRLPERASHASGTLVNLLLEQDDVVLDTIIKLINNKLGKAINLVLRIAQDNYTVDRLIKYTGEDGLPAVMKFKGSTLKGNTDVRVVSQTGLPKSRALRTEFIMRAHQMGLIPDVRDAVEMMEFGTAEKMFKDNLVHERKAHRENLLIQGDKNINPQETATWVHPLEDKMAHLKVHIRFLFSTLYDKLNQNQKMALESHAMITYQQIMQEQMQQVQPGGQPSQESSQPTPPQGQAVGGEEGGL